MSNLIKNQPMMKNKFQLGLVLGILLLLGCGGDGNPEEKPIRPVRYQEVVFGGSNTSRTFGGTARTNKIINLSFRASGIITERNLAIGQQVKKGQLLAKLDTVQARLNYESAVASLNSAESQMNTAKLSLDRVRSLYEKGSMSLSDFEAAKNSYKTAQQGYESAKRGVGIQQEQIRFGYLYAPEDGTISAVNSEVDENVSPGQIVAVLNAGTDMEISLGLPESIINGVSNGQEVAISFPSLPESNFNGKVTEVAPAVDVNTATYPVRIRITNPSDAIRSGMSANVTFNFAGLEEARPSLVVPPQAVGEDSNGRFVFVIRDEGGVTTVKKQPVTVGNLTVQGFEITSGLESGQKIATAGLQTLLDGQQVKLQ
jgi:RND family efflux transporter MFP subunit